MRIETALRGTIAMTYVVRVLGISTLSTAAAFNSMAECALFRWMSFWSITLMVPRNFFLPANVHDGESLLDRFGIEDHRVDQINQSIEDSIIMAQSTARRANYMR